MDRKTVLVVDDNDNHRWVCHQILADEGYDILAAKNAREASEKVAQKPPDLVVTDLLTQEMDGMEVVLRRVRGNRNIPMVLYSACPRHRDDSLRWAVDAYVLKSPDFRELKSKVKELLSVPHQEVKSL